ncbi:MAG: hypothetical protein JWQ27_1570 [Ferruginibacter sp.]|nr:hypothetical protein [Ferruginibacter sp.]
MKHLFWKTLIVAATISACNSNQPDHDDSIIPAAKAEQPMTILKDSASSTTASPAVLPNPVPDKSLTAALNPAHGLPGHRCDIQVGAPLNSAPNPAANTGKTAPMTAPAPMPATMQPSSGAGKINPPHGQPGHDCSVGVGQPLKN